jgi:iron(III) transport system substrate-binding protein
MIELHLRQLAAAFVCAAAVAIPGAHCARAADASMIEGAKNEGKLVIYTGVERTAAQAMVEAFHKKYPFIDAQQVRASSSKLATRLDAEIEANRVGGDVFEYSLLYLTTDLKKRGEILQYNSPEYAAYPKSYADPSYWAATGLSSIIILLNTKRVGADNVPKSWWDLTKPYWRNKLTIDNLEVSGTGYDWLVEIVNDQRLGWKFIEELGKNKPALERGHAGMAQKVAAGEYFGAIEMSDFHLQGLRNASATVPLLGVWPSEGVPQEPWTAGILKRAQHPNAAKLYLDFLLSQEGQTLYVREMGWTSARKDVESPGFKEMPKDIKTLEPGMSADEMLKVRDSYVEKWKQLWNLGGSRAPK